MRFSDWRSDVCSSDLPRSEVWLRPPSRERSRRAAARQPGLPEIAATRIDRKSVVSGKSVSVRVDLGSRRIIKQKKKHTNRDSPTLLRATCHHTNRSYSKYKYCVPVDDHVSRII